MTDETTREAHLVECPKCGELNRAEDPCEVCWLICRHNETETPGT